MKIDVKHGRSTYALSNGEMFFKIEKEGKNTIVWADDHDDTKFRVEFSIDEVMRLYNAISSAKKGEGEKAHE